ALSISSEPLGISNESSYRDIDLALHSGDILVICTDGLLESFNELGVQYSSENLVNAIHASCTLSGEKIAEHIKQDVLKYCEQTQQYDDMSLMAIKIN
ncbi:MAG: serine/threonine-protein phosphatase, partial [Treponema sp.]|nr:serine/threonine-protein phosphatase [Treponema sp.]